jgi:hypothetical protein
MRHLVIRKKEHYQYRVRCGGKLHKDGGMSGDDCDRVAVDQVYSVSSIPVIGRSK